ncbi:hypothetical protein M758_4G252300 [Ceratodon purpureus]|nr:hypothetical protein M758_4G252300 [Ceratodon purpureus]
MAQETVCLYVQDPNSTESDSLSQHALKNTIPSRSAHEKELCSDGERRCHQTDCMFHKNFTTKGLSAHAREKEREREENLRNGSIYYTMCNGINVRKVEGDMNWTD